MLKQYKRDPLAGHIYARMCAKCGAHILAYIWPGFAEFVYFSQREAYSTWISIRVWQTATWTERQPYGAV